MNPTERSAIMLTAYGSLYPNALATYEKIKKFYGQQFPESEIVLAFTSEFMRRRLKDRDILVPNPMTALAELHDIGYRDVLIQSLQIVPGREFHDVSSLIAGLQSVYGKFGFDRLMIGLPLLAGIDDCRKVSLALEPIFNSITIDGAVVHKLRDPEKTAAILMGHGTGHPADGLYSMFSSVLRNEHLNVFLGTLEGYPGIAELLVELKRAGVEEIRLIPLLLVAGGHAYHDMIGDGPESWKSILEQHGYKNDTYLTGLGESEDILKIFLEHSRNAMQ
jgi:sirohydrochlorin cobaltochelatase